MDCGTVLFKSKTGHHEKVLKHYRELEVEFEDWDTETLAERVPYYDVHAFWPPRRPDDEVFWQKRRRGAAGRDLHAGVRVRERPAACVPQPPARGRGQGRRVPVQPGDRGHPPERARAGRDARERRGDRRPCRRQRRRPALVRHQPDGGRREGHEDRHPRPASRGAHRPGSRRRRLRARGLSHLRRRPGDLLPPRVRQQHPCRKRGSGVRPAGLGRGARRVRPQRDQGAVGGSGLSRGPAHSRRSHSRTSRAESSISTTSPTTGSRSTTSPTSTASTWPSARAATSSRTPRSSAT